MKIDHSNLSRTASHALRHEPEAYGLTLDAEGWVEIAELVRALRDNDPRWEEITEADIRDMVHRSVKVRHEISGGRIRALYGHSIPGSLTRERKCPPKFLFHGTTSAASKMILAQGLKTMSRQNVHLSIDEETARQVGRRKDANPVILQIDAEKASQSGVNFFQGNDSVWLADDIPAEFIAEDLRNN